MIIHINFNELLKLGGGVKSPRYESVKSLPLYFSKTLELERLFFISLHSMCYGMNAK